jgi:probable rRNA maturation factor
MNQLLRIEVSMGDGLPESALEESWRYLERAIEATLTEEQIETAAVSLTLLSDAQISALNEKYLGHEGPTDVISFPLYEPGETPVGDIYIGYEQAARQSADLSVALEAELSRLAIHGTLHVLGYDHPKDGAREDSELWRRQERILRQLLGD